MNRTVRYRKVRRLQIVLAGLIVLLVQAIVIEKGNLSKIIYAGEPAAQGARDRTPIVIDRAPLRFIKDPNPGFSAVAVDSDHNTLVATDENNFRINEYDSRDNTPATARLTEPKRVISGTNTKF